MSQGTMSWSEHSQRNNFSNMTCEIQQPGPEERGRMLTKPEQDLDDSTIAGKRHRSNIADEKYNGGPSGTRAVVPVYNRTSTVQPCTKSSSFSTKRRFSSQLPSFSALGISSSRSGLPTQSGGLNRKSSSMNDLEGEYCLAPALSNRALPPTPPPEDMSDLKFAFRLQTARSGDNAQTTPFQTPCAANQSHENAASLPPHGVSMPPPPPPPAGTAGSSQSQMTPWTSKAFSKIVTALNSTMPYESIQVTSQTLPSQAKDSRSRPTFEEMLEVLQSDLETMPYVTITHAVPQARVMEELPKTPPSTPNIRHERHDYFDNDQAIFVHAAVVPIYHRHDRVEVDVATRLAHHIAAPGSIQVSILERFIPPTMPQEVDDFFSISGRSYLADRLSELSPNNGSLLLVYPTRNGGRAFANQYLGPLLDPHLRQFMMLNGLTADAATLMGTMTAVDDMIPFDEMQTRVTNLCRSLPSRAAARGSRSVFRVSHSEVTDVVLDRSTWLDWYTEQEQSRLRQNLVEYHQSGGRMPAASGNREVTVGMLTRDFINGLHKHRKTASDAVIEVGVFLITRSST